MSWLDDLAAELTARGVRGSDRRRILLELEDHIACEPGCQQRLGGPRELALTFADELATSRARRSVVWAVAALTLTALALIVSQLALGPAGGYPGYDHGLSIALFIPALLGMVFAPQVALVAGLLSLWRAARRRRTTRLPGAEIGLLENRTRVALLAGLGTAVGLGLYLANFSAILPGWYLALVGGLTTAAAASLVLALRGLGRAAGILSETPGPAGDVYDDLPLTAASRLRRRPWLLGLVGSLLLAIAAVVFTGHAEHSLAEGLQRGIPEGLAAALGFALLGRTVGLFPGQGPRPAPAIRRLDPGSVAWPVAGADEQLAADEDRSDAELILRDSFAHGRLSLEDLTRRVGEVHEAETIAQLRRALRGLRPRS